jgi:hypothetical protein
MCNYQASLNQWFAKVLLKDELERDIFPNDVPVVDKEENLVP